MSDNSQVRPVAAALSIFGGMAALGLTDNFVRILAAEAGLWQFHATRAVMSIPLLLLLGWFGMGRLRPKRPLNVLARSVIIAAAMLIYFGCLGFLPIGVVAAGLFTSPIFVLLISVFFQGRSVGRIRWLSVGIGFCGVLLVIQPDPNALDLVVFAPVLAGLLYAIGAVATRAWCESESTLALTTGFFTMLGIFGAIGMIVVPTLGLDVPEGADGFVRRGPVPMTGTFLLWTAVQAVGSVIGIALIFRGYLIGDATYVSIFDYSLMIFASFWAYMIWGEGLNLIASIGVGLIILSGVVIALRAKESVQ